MYWIACPPGSSLLRQWRRRWQVDKDPRSFEDVFAEQRDRLVYLTADSEQELEVLSTDDIYIIGVPGSMGRHGC